MMPYSLGKVNDIPVNFEEITDFLGILMIAHIDFCETKGFSPDANYKAESLNGFVRIYLLWQGQLTESSN